MSIVAPSWAVSNARSPAWASMSSFMWVRTMRFAFQLRALLGERLVIQVAGSLRVEEVALADEQVGAA